MTIQKWQKRKAGCVNLCLILLLFLSGSAFAGKPYPTPTPTPYPTPTPTPYPTPTPTPPPTPTPTPTPKPTPTPTPVPTPVPTPTPPKPTPTPPKPGATPTPTPSPSPTPKPSATPKPIVLIKRNNLQPLNQTMQINSLRDFAFANPSQTEAAVSDPGTMIGYSKDGKTVVDGKASKLIVDQPGFQRWGIWAAADYYGDGRNVGTGTLGIDYRITEHWLVGINGRLGWIDRHAGIGIAQGGVYTAFYTSQGYWGVMGGLVGPHQYTVYTGGGKDWRIGNFLIGPVGVYQWDEATEDTGLGEGQLSQFRVGGRVAMVGRLSPWVQVMYQRQVGDFIGGNENAIWAGFGLQYQINDRWSVWSGYAFEGNTAYQLNQATLGVRTGF